MSHVTVVSLAEASANLPALIDSVAGTRDRITITRDGVPVAVMMWANAYEGMLETIEILSDPEAVAAIKEGTEDLAAGRGYTVEEVEREMRKAGRLPKGYHRP